MTTSTTIQLAVLLTVACTTTTEQPVVPATPVTVTARLENASKYGNGCRIAVRLNANTDTLTLDYGVYLSESFFEEGSFQDQQLVRIDFPAQPIELEITWWAATPTDTLDWGGWIRTSGCAP